MARKLLLVIFIFCISHLSAYDKEFYIAAVYAYDPGVFISENVTSREDALHIMSRNLDVLAAQVAIAKSEGTDIFVFPEYGISGLMEDVLYTSYFVEIIPDPMRSPPFCPCAGEYIQSGQEVLHRLSCIAKNNEMYISVNMGDKKPCLLKSDAKCPAIGHYQYNTEVVFDKQGCLKMKYHKQNLFEMEKLRWNVPDSVDISYFDTDFGRFGLMICFDAVYKSPAVDLVEQYNVTDIIFSTAWMNVYPHYMSTAYHSGWARTMRVNYLSSNIQFPISRFVGSGIYGPHGVLSYTFNSSTSIGQLLVSKVPINIRVNNKFPTKSLFPVQRNSSSQVFFEKIFDDIYKFVEVADLSGNATVCNGTVCCNLEFSRSDDMEYYALGVFNNMHYLEGEYYLEVCLLVQCVGHHQDCGMAVPKRVTTQFHSFNLTGTMNTKYVFPEVVTPDLNFTTDWDFVDEGYVKTIIGRNKNLASVVLMGRNFNKDPHTSAISSEVKVEKEKEGLTTSDAFSGTFINLPTIPMLVLLPAVLTSANLCFSLI